MLNMMNLWGFALFLWIFIDPSSFCQGDQEITLSRYQNTITSGTNTKKIHLTSIDVPDNFGNEFRLYNYFFDDRKIISLTDIKFHEENSNNDDQLIIVVCETRGSYNKILSAPIPVQSSCSFALYKLKTTIMTTLPVRKTGSISCCPTQNYCRFDSIRNSAVTQLECDMYRSSLNDKSIFSKFNFQYFIQLFEKKYSKSDYFTSTIGVDLTDIQDTPSPTSVPTSTPTSYPSLTPSTYPYLSPVVKSRNIPTPLPSINSEISTYNPSISPTQEPFSLPSFSPSLKLTNLPLNRPTSHPTAQPSQQPFCKPSAEPTNQPTSQPTSQPSNQPTSDPTHQPSNQPTSQPTSQPSQSPITLSLSTTTAALNYLTSLFVNEGYSNTFVNSQSCVGNSLRSLADWSIFTSALTSLDQLNNPVQIAYLSTVDSCKGLSIDGLYSSPVRKIVCSDFVSVSSIWNALMKSINVIVPCGLNSWNVQVCTDKVVKICVNCQDPCAFNSNQSLPFLSNSSSFQNSLEARGIGFITSPKENIWPMWKQKCFSSFSSVIVQYNLQSNGKIICNIIPFLSSSLLNNPVSLTAGGVVNYVYNGQGNITFNNLPSPSSWQVLCYTESFIQAPGFIFRSPINKTYSSSCTVSTQSQPVTFVLLNSTFSTLLAGSISPAISISLSQLPVQSVIAIPYTVFLDGDCGLYHGLSFNYSESKNDTAIIAPSSLTFEKSATQSFYLQPLFAGCYFVSVAVSAANSNQYLTDSRSSFFFKSYLLQQTPDYLQVVYCAFVGSGSQMELKFSQRTDQGVSAGLPSANWNCSILLSFPSSSLSSCFFRTSRAVSITLPSSSYELPVIGTKVTVKSGVIKPACVNMLSSLNNLLCSDVPFLQNVIVNVSSMVVITPNVAISAPSTISTNTSLTLDLSASSGSAGRPWQSIVWNVSQSTGMPIEDIQYYLNNELSWFQCLPGSIYCNVIPGYFFQNPGYYVFTLTLTNFFGISNKNTYSVNVQQQLQAPQVWILGASYIYTHPNNTLSIQSKISGQTSSTVLFSWFVYSNGVLQTNILDESLSDNTKFIVGRYKLTPGVEYTFEVVVSLVGVSSLSTAYVTVYVLPGDIIPVLLGGAMAGIPSAGSLYLDASQSYETSTGGSNSLSYRWSCVQLNPLSSSGCDDFNYALISSNQYNSSTINLPASLLNVQVSYRFTVLITSSIIPGSSSLSQIVSVFISSSVAAPSILLASVPSKIDNSVPNVVSASIQYSDGLIASWVYLNTAFNTSSTLISQTFQSGGSIPFPLSISPNSLVAGRVYTFRLIVQSINCASSCVQIFSDISLTTNSPPTSGTFIAVPTYGDENTLFALYLENWQDIDLPIYYAFFDIDQNGNRLLIQQQSLLSYATSRLSVSNSTNNQTLVLASIFDSLGSKTSVTVSVFVRRSINSINVALTASIELNSAYQQKDPNGALLVTSSLVKNLQASCSLSPSTEYSSECISLTTVTVKAVNTVLQLSNADPDTVATLTTSLSVLASSVAVSGSFELANSSVTSALNLASAYALIQPSYIQRVSPVFYNAVNNIASGLSRYSLKIKNSRRLQSVELSILDLLASLESSLWAVVTYQYMSTVVGQSISISLDSFDIYVSKNWVNAKKLQWNVSDLINLRDSTPNNYSTSTLGYALVLSRLRPNSTSQQLYSQSAYYASMEYKSLAIYNNPVLSLNFPNPGLPAASNSSVVMKNVSCNTDPFLFDLVISCSSEETGGPEYSVSLPCYNSSTSYKYSCPKYSWISECLINGVVSNNCEQVVNADGTIQCICSDQDVPYKITTDTNLANKFNLSAKFEMDSRLVQVIEPVVHINFARDYSRSSSSSSVSNLTAIIAITVVFVVAGVIGGKKLYDIYRSNETPVETQAAVVGANTENPFKLEDFYDLKVITHGDVEAGETPAAAEAIAVPVVPPSVDPTPANIENQSRMRSSSDHAPVASRYDVASRRASNVSEHGAMSSLYDIMSRRTAIIPDHALNVPIREAPSRRLFTSPDRDMNPQSIVSTSRRISNVSDRSVSHQNDQLRRVSSTSDQNTNSASALARVGNSMLSPERRARLRAESGAASTLQASASSSNQSTSDEASTTSSVEDNLTVDTLYQEHISI